MTWLNKFAMKYVLTPEKLADRELSDARLALFQAERQLLEAEMRVDYHRNVLDFLATISADGVENFAEKQRPKMLSSSEHKPRITPDCGRIKKFDTTALYKSEAYRNQLLSPSLMKFDTNTSK
ncbi:hypothetical protein [Glaciimonas soli]|uniref:Uncharacterized protein n=1 Tax=Glaciimonas soli TaxID=2590999 RepID=A0A843YXI8_9BURK|nr:hypothetical protein [Glaciimonas soli]MQR01266.1 hypothetical protein [Glaciimonas soli]